ncbi:MAG: ATP synthase subunit I [Cellulosilyticaceae bacterium]
MIGFSIIAYGVGCFLTENVMAWTLGVVLGLIISILKLKLMEQTFTKAVTLEENKAKGYTQRQYMIRYGLTGLVLLIAALSETISLVGVFVGLISMKVGAYSELYRSN